MGCKTNFILKENNGILENNKIYFKNNNGITERK
jgi:hypothetical protein